MLRTAFLHYHFSIFLKDKSCNYLFAFRANRFCRSHALIPTLINNFSGYTYSLDYQIDFDSILLSRALTVKPEINHDFHIKPEFPCIYRIKASRLKAKSGHIASNKKHSGNVQHLIRSSFVISINCLLYLP